MSAADFAELYKDQAGEWRTRVKARNGETIFDSAEGYVRRIDALEMLARHFPGIGIVEVDPPDGDPDSDAC